jgi:hypothetical protein
VIPIRTIDEGIAVLTGKEAGTRNNKGQFPKGSINRLVEEQMRSFANIRRDFARVKEPSGSENE